MYDFLTACESLFGMDNIVIFITINETLFREITTRLYAEGVVPNWFVTIRYIDWTGDIKDFTFVNVDSTSVLLIDHYEGVIHS